MPVRAPRRRRLAAAIVALALPTLALVGVGAGGASGSPAVAHIHVMRRHAAVAAAAAGVSASTEVGNMTTLGGPVQATSTSYAIYWMPPGSLMSSNFQSVTSGYLHDVGGSSYYGLAGQYGAQNSSTFGGSWVDTSLFPAGRGTSVSPLSDSDVQAAVTAAIAQNSSWGPPTTNKSFFVFLPFGVYLSEGGTTSFTSGGFCAYHSYFSDASGRNVVYAAMPYAGTDPSGCGRPGPWPNQAGDPIHPGDADNEVNLVSHEQLEAVTDPLLTAWGFPSGSPIAGYEIGDVCLGVNGNRNSDGSNVSFAGHPYLVQAQWSNADAPPPDDTQAYGCVLSRGVAATTPSSTSTSTTSSSTTSSSTTSSSTTSSTSTSTTSTTQPGAAAAATRLSGPDRIATAISISNDLYPAPGSAGAVVLSRSDGFADALAGTPLAAANKGPLLLTPSGSGLDPRVASEITRVLPSGGTVFILGGPSAVAPLVDSSLGSQYHVVRLAGADRFATAVTIADTGLGNPSLQLLATGLDFPDALAGGAAAANGGGAVLLTDGTAIPPATANYLAAHPATRWALGGPAAAAGSAVGATPIVGADRYDTAARVASTFFSNPTVVGAASGSSFPDALGGGVHAAAHHAPLLLVATGALPGPVTNYLSSLQPATVRGYVYGGTAAVSDATASALAAAL